MAKFLVTGSAGFLGSHLCHKLLDQGHTVVGVDNLVTGQQRNLEPLINNTRFEFIQADVSTACPDVGPLDGVFHLACPASPKDFIPLADTILKVGSYGTFNTLEMAQKYQAWYFLSSTSEVYGDPLVHPQKESYLGNVNPNGIRGVYDESKRFSESIVSSFVRAKKVKASVVRIFNTYGPNMRADDGRVVSNFITQALKNEPLTVHGEGLQTRSFCYVSDLIEGIYKFWEIKPQGPINLGNDGEYKVIDIAQTVLDLTGSESKIEFHPLPQDDPKQRCPDLTRAKTLLGFVPKVGLKEGLEKTIQYFRQSV